MKQENFNCEWLFHPGGGTALENTVSKPAEAVHITLPHDAAIREPRDPNTPFGNCTGYFPSKTVHYTKTFQIEDPMQVCYLEFEGVYMNAAVYVNGALAGQHINGYTPFTIDISPYLHAGENEVKVLVRNGVSSSRWYTGTGIYRNVHLLRAGRLHIAPNGVRISTQQAEPDLAVLVIETILENRNDTVCDTVLRHHIGNVEVSAPVTMLPRETKSVTLRMELEHPKLWSVDTPNLYTCETELAGIDQASTRFGVRTLCLDSRHGLRINGETVKLRGGCIHHDFGVVGAADNRALEERRIRRLKEAGYNAVLCAHFPASRTLLDVCDEVGMLVMNELCDAWTQPKVDFDYATWFDQCWEQDCEAMVALSFNHPSVIIYSIGNEICEISNKFEAQHGRKIADKLRRLDPSRYITNGVNIPLSVIAQLPAIAVKAGLDINTLLNSGLAGLSEFMARPEIVEPLEEALSYLDIAGYNYTPYRYLVDAQTHPERIFVGSESYPAALFDNWALCERMPQILGDFSWSAWDYIGEAGVGQLRYGEATDFDLYGGYPWKTAWCGDFDLIGDRRPISYWREIVWGRRDSPYIAVQSPFHHGEKQSPTRWGWSDAERCWNWKGAEGKPVTVEVYSNADEVELLRDSELVGRVKPEQCKALFDTVYTPGVLTAVSYRNGAETGRDVLASASYDVQLQQTDLGCGIIEISVVDEHGTLNPDADVELTIKADGDLSILGFGTADPKGKANFFDTTAKTYRGRALAVTCGEGKMNAEVNGYV